MRVRQLSSRGRGVAVVSVAMVTLFGLGGPPDKRTTGRAIDQLLQIWSPKATALPDFVR